MVGYGGRAVLQQVDRAEMSIEGYPLFFHWHPCKLKGAGSTGLWVELVDGSTALVPSDGKKQTCLGAKPQDVSPCDRCGWEAKWIKQE